MVLKVLIAVLVLLALLLSVPVGVDVGYNENGLRLFIRVWRFTFCVFPRKPKGEKPSERKEKQPASQENKPKQKKGLPNVTKDEVLDAIGTAVRSVKKLRFQLYRLKLHFVSAFDDPYQTAMVYGYANAAVQALGMPNWKRSDVALGVDFERESCYFDGYLSVTVRIYYILKLCVCLVSGMLPILLRRRKRMKAIVKNTAVKGKVA